MQLPLACVSVVVDLEPRRVGPPAWEIVAASTQTIQDLLEIPVAAILSLAPGLLHISPGSANSSSVSLTRVTYLYLHHADDYGWVLDMAAVQDLKKLLYFLYLC